MDRIDSSSYLASQDSRLDKARHIKYWLRCIKTVLPQQYTGNDSNRMYLGYFMVAALELLGALETALSDDERHSYVDWIYHCQHPNGGFRMWPGTDFGERSTEVNAKWDPANVPATYFALSALLLLGDDLKRVRRRQTLQWLRRMQRPDGSFGETLVDGRLEGSRDPRFGYCAAGVRFILRGSGGGSLRVDGVEVDDIDVDATVACIRRAETFDGGIADQPFHEPHSGYIFCSLGALRFLNRLNPSSSNADSKVAPSDPEAVSRWLLNRQTDLLDPDATLDTEFLSSHKSSKLTADAFAKISSQLDPEPSRNGDCTGMNGRTNKVADTCYCWWTGAALHILGRPQLYDALGVRKYLLDKTQNPVLGGFGKFPGDLPDLYHSYLALAALSLAGEEGVKGVDAGMCVSKEARGRLEALWREWGVGGEGDGG